ncbi:cell division protein SepF [Bacillus sp. BB56-3]|uniref:cell division protein SepF n=1 Tax=Bacillus sp. BB56-3 TaxID=2217831 RepID=UPI0011EED3A4|nr:cell division protein SepF [Bacillus sp. BB56-3]KAA0784324.1 cell division protein SepF [Bacillus sp. BB56-3]
MNKQLNIFDVEPGIVKFEARKAHVKQRKGKASFADILAKIPKNAKDIDELPKKAVKKEGPDNRFDLFVDYTTALWRYQRSKAKDFSWEKAVELCKEMRDRGTAVELRIYLDSGFEPLRVEQYLR